MRLCSTSSPARRSISPAATPQAAKSDCDSAAANAPDRRSRKQAGGIVIPAPPQIARERPQPFLRRRDKAIEGARFADDGRDFARPPPSASRLRRQGRREARRLHHEHALQNAVIDQGHAEKRLISVFAGFAEVFEPRMVPHLFHGDRPHLLGHQPSQPFVQPEAQRANALGTQVRASRPAPGWRDPAPADRRSKHRS